GDDHFSEVIFDDVRPQAAALLGSEGAGWQQVNADLAFESSGPERILSSMVLMDGWLQHLRARQAPTQAQQRLAGHVVARLAALRNMSLMVTGLLARGESPVVEASMVKDLGTTFEQAAPNLIADDLASLPDEAFPEHLAGVLEYNWGMSPSYSLRGGTREILRGIIARGLGLR